MFKLVELDIHKQIDDSASNIITSLQNIVSSTIVTERPNSQTQKAMIIDISAQSILRNLAKL